MRAHLVSVLALILAGCASRDLWPIERVDPETAVHLTIMAEPWVYALDDPRQAANASEFLDLTVVETNRAGTRSYWLNAAAWSTGARGDGAAAHATDGPVKLRLSLPARQAEFECAADGGRAAGILGPAIPEPRARDVDAWCPLSAAQVAEFAAGPPSAAALVGEDGGVRAYAAWRVNAAAIAEFLKATGATAN